MLLGRITSLLATSACLYGAWLVTGNGVPPRHSWQYTVEDSSLTPLPGELTASAALNQLITFLRSHSSAPEKGNATLCLEEIGRGERWWEFNADRFISVASVDADTGLIVSFERFDADVDRLPSVSPKRWVLRTTELATKQAMAIFIASGAPSGLVVKSRTSVDPNSNASQMFKIVVNWWPASEPLLYAHNSGAIVLNAATGDLLSLGQSYGVIPAKNPRMIDKTSAVLNAKVAYDSWRAKYDKRSVLPTAPIDSRLAYVVPNKEFGAPKPSDTLPSIARLCYVTFYKRAPNKRASDVAVFVDATSGQVIGGEHPLRYAGGKL